MFSTLRNRFGIPGVISVVALVFAMFGGAYAASNSSGGDKAATSAKAKKGPRGPKGATGPAGPAGAQGPVGPAGAKGDVGANGSNGGVGATGPTGPTGKNGATGATGATGFAGFTETLPPGETETGTWADAVTYPGASIALAIPISFPIPLPAAGEAYIFNKEETENEEFGTSGCTGSVANPTAPPGVLCGYTADEENFGYSKSPFTSFNQSFSTYQQTGTVIRYFSEEATASLTTTGAWAVTAPTP